MMQTVLPSIWYTSERSLQAASTQNQSNTSAAGNGKAPFDLILTSASMLLSKIYWIIYLHSSSRKNYKAYGPFRQVRMTQIPLNQAQE